MVIWLQSLSAVLDYWRSPDDVDGCSLVGEFSDRTLLLVIYHILGSRLSRYLGKLFILGESKV